ncbi:MAG TPA: hypothetical protein VI895_03480 [Bdellovibrionota bacterium]|nr:hypothetical protein [Bdellovibrionota bacterium]
MPIHVRCACGAEYPFRDDMRGKLFKCQKCGAPIRVESTGAPVAPSATAPSQDPIFQKDKYLLRQKHFAISDKYGVFDEQGQELLFIQRPAHLLRNLFAVFAAFIMAGISFLVVMTFGGWAFKTHTAQGLTVLLAAPVALMTMGVTWFLLMRRRNVHFYHLSNRRAPILIVFQENKLEFPTLTYTMRDQGGKVLAYFRKNALTDLIRRRWTCMDAAEKPWFEVREDSILLSLLRRYLLGTFFGLLRTNFVFTDPTGEYELGVFNRKFTILDRYVLDLSPDASKRVDRRVGLAMGVLLDTAERR